MTEKGIDVASGSVAHSWAQANVCARFEELSQSQKGGKRITQNP